MSVSRIDRLRTTYEVDKILEGFKLILFRVRASGMGMLGGMQKSGVSLVQLKPNRDITVTASMITCKNTACFVN